MGAGAVRERGGGRFLGVLCGWGAEIDFSQPHFWIGYEGSSDARIDAQPPLPERLEAPARCGAGRSHGHAENPVLRIPNRHAREDVAGADSFRFGAAGDLAAALRRALGAPASAPDRNRIWHVLPWRKPAGSLRPRETREARAPGTGGRSTPRSLRFFEVAARGIAR